MDTTHFGTLWTNLSQKLSDGSLCLFLHVSLESLTAKSGSTMRWIAVRRASDLELNCDDFGDGHLSDLVPPVTCKNQHPPHQSELNMQTLAC